VDLQEGGLQRRQSAGGARGGSAALVQQDVKNDKKPFTNFTAVSIIKNGEIKTAGRKTPAKRKRPC
jgi:hypothetical protein